MVKKHKAVHHVGGVIMLPWLLLKKYRYKRRYMQKQRDIANAVKIANQLAKETTYRYLVLEIDGKIIIKPKRVLKNMLACKGKYFKRGIAITDLEKAAIYVTK